MLVLDSGALTRLAERSTRSLALIRSLRTTGTWPPVVPSVVLVESLRGRGTVDANVNRLLKTCLVEEHLSTALARRAAHIRRAARSGSAVDAIVVATAEPGGTVLTGDLIDVTALAAHARDVAVERV